MKLAKLISSLLGVTGLILMAFVPMASAAACSNTSGYGVVTFTGVSTNVPSAGTYYIWSRINVPASSNGYQLEVNGSSCFQVTAANTNTWVWSNGSGSTRATFNFTTLTGNTIKMIGLNPNVKVDRVILTSDGACTPTGLGDNCGSTVSTGGTGGGSAGGTPQAPPPASGSTVTGTTNPSTTLANTPSNDVAQTEYYVDGKKVQTSNGSQPLDTTLLTNGTHQIETKVTLKNGSTVSDTTTLDINNKQTIFSPMVRWVRINKRPLSIGGVTLGTAAVAAGGFVAIRHLYLQRRFMRFHGF